jgi:hypothetical protein
MDPLKLINGDADVALAGHTQHLTATTMKSTVADNHPQLEHGGGGAPDRHQAETRPKTPKSSYFCTWEETLTRHNPRALRETSLTTNLINKI